MKHITSNLILAASACMLLPLDGSSFGSPTRRLFAKKDDNAGGKGGGDEEGTSELRSEYVATGDAFDKAAGDEFGGTSEILDLKVGESAMNLIYTGFQPSTIGGKQMNVHTANTKDGSPVRLPIAASFLRALDQSGLKRGDTFGIKRYEGVEKKGGVGAGTMMEIYGLKVTNKVAEGN